MSEEFERVREPMPDEFASRAEVAEFWDTRDITDYLDALKPAELKFSDGLAHDVLIRFASHTFWKVCRIASERGKLR